MDEARYSAFEVAMMRKYGHDLWNAARTLDWDKSYEVLRDYADRMDSKTPLMPDIGSAFGFVPTPINEEDYYKACHSKLLDLARNTWMKNATEDDITKICEAMSVAGEFSAMQIVPEVIYNDTTDLCKEWNRIHPDSPMEVIFRPFEQYGDC